MSDWVFYCWKCKNSTNMVDKVMRADTCPHCGADMHSCKNCMYHDTNYHNECKEHVAFYVPDKEKFNFCGMYEPHDGPFEPDDDIDLAKARLKALFSK